MLLLLLLLLLSSIAGRSLDIFLASDCFFSSRLAVAKSWIFFLLLKEVFACKLVREVLIFLANASFESEEASMAISYETFFTFQNQNSNHFSAALLCNSVA